MSGNQKTSADVGIMKGALHVAGKMSRGVDASRRYQLNEMSLPSSLAS